MDGKSRRLRGWARSKAATDDEGGVVAYAEASFRPVGGVGAAVMRREQFDVLVKLAEEIAHAVREFSCVLDGEICCLECDGRSNFKKLLFRREWPHFYAFDALSIEGDDLTGLPPRTASARV